MDPNTTMSDDDLYASDADDQSKATEPEPKETDDNGADDATEALLPKSILAGKDFNVGDKLEVEVTAIHDKEISVKYSTGKDDESSEPMDKADMPAKMGAGDSDYD